MKFHDGMRVKMIWFDDSRCCSEASVLLGYDTQARRYDKILVNIEEDGELWFDCYENDEVRVKVNGRHIEEVFFSAPSL